MGPTIAGDPVWSFTGMSIILIGSNHRTAPMHVREQVALKGADVQAANGNADAYAQALRDLFALDEPPDAAGQTEQSRNETRHVSPSLT